VGLERDDTLEDLGALGVRPELAAPMFQRWVLSMLYSLQFVHVLGSGVFTSIEHRCSSLEERNQPLQVPNEVLN